jgi:lactoylglutathione lyase
MFRSVFPILTVRDVQRSLGFYRDLLDGDVRYQFPPEGDPVYVSVVVGESPIGIGLDDGTAPGAVGASVLWVYVDDVDAAVARLEAADTPVVAPPVDQEWGERTARVTDPDGNTIHLGQEASGP